VVAPARLREPAGEVVRPVQSESQSSEPRASAAADRLSPMLETFDFDGLDPPQT